MCEVDEDAFEYKAEELDRGSDDHKEGANEEGLIPKIKKILAKPTAEEVEQHMATHIPFREWCPHCVAGKSKIDPHIKGSKGQRTIPKISLDYMYMTTGKQEEQMDMSSTFRTAWAHFPFDGTTAAMYHPDFSSLPTNIGMPICSSCFPMVMYM